MGGRQVGEAPVLRGILRGTPALQVGRAPATRRLEGSTRQRTRATAGQARLLRPLQELPPRRRKGREQGPDGQRQAKGRRQGRAPSPPSRAHPCQPSHGRMQRLRMHCGGLPQEPGHTRIHRLHPAVGVPRPGTHVERPPLLRRPQRAVQRGVHAAGTAPQGRRAHAEGVPPHLCQESRTVQAEQR